MAAPAHASSLYGRSEPVTDINTNWKTISSSEAQRPLQGPELAINYAEFFNQGDFQLTAAFPFKTSLDSAVLERRFPAAIWLARKLLPELGTRTAIKRGPSDPDHSSSRASNYDIDHASFEAIFTLEAALEWLGDTACVVHGADSFDELCKTLSNRRIEPAGKQFRAYLVVNPKRGPPALLFNVSHVLNGHRMLFQAQTIFENLLHSSLEHDTRQLSDARSGRFSSGQTDLVKAVFEPEVLSSLLDRLPISVTQAYASRFRPGPEELAIGTEKLVERMKNEPRPTIGIPSVSRQSGPQPSEHPMVNIRRCFARSEQDRFRSKCKQNKATISSYIYASVVKAIDETTGSPESDKGAHLTFPAHASRWLPQETGKHARPPVNMAIAPGSVFLDRNEIDGEGEGETQAAQIQDVFRMARIIGAKQNAYLGSPHLMASLDTLGKAVAEGALAASQATDSPDTGNSFSTPTLTSQGAFDIPIDYPVGASDRERAERTSINLLDVVQYGRATSPSVCFSMYSFDGTLSLMVHFDARRFDHEVVVRILDRACELIYMCCGSAML